MAQTEFFLALFLSAAGRQSLGVKERLWQRLVGRVPHDPTFAIVDGFPIAAGQFARAHRCRRFRGEAAFGKDSLVRQTF